MELNIFFKAPFEFLMIWFFLKISGYGDVLQ